jgi:glycosyltransferase involved in cell wall biosynthesis
MTKIPDVSVIMANHNGAAFLESAVQSVLSQNQCDLELIVSDDASTDDSLDILSTINDPRLRVVTAQTNKGPGAARNKALDAATGTWVAIVDSDDLMHADRFQTLLSAAKTTDTTLIADNQMFFEGDNQATGEYLWPKTSGVIEVDAAMLLSTEFYGRSNRLGYLKPMIRRDALADLRYQPDLKVGEDFDLLARLTLAGHTLTLIPDALYFYRRRESSTSHRLTPENATAMIDALTTLDTQDPAHQRAIRRRIGRLEHRKALETTVQDLKSKQPIRAAAHMLRYPSIIPALGSIAKQKLIKRPAPTPSTQNETLPMTPQDTAPKVHVRVPTYKRPEQLRRALTSLLSQTEPDWLCHVYDDDLDRTGESVVADLNDPRIVYHPNPVNLKASENIDRCFSKQNPYGADYFFVLEDDNQVLPTHLEDNIRIIEREGINVVLRNQLVEHDFGTEKARLSETGVLDEKFEEGTYSPERFHLALIADMGVSNGGLFWSKNAISDLEVGEPTSATLQEYLRTFAIIEPVYIAMTPTAIWAENGVNTTRDFGMAAGWFRRELALKRSVQILQQLVWRRADLAARTDFVDGSGFKYPAAMRASGLVKSHISLSVGEALSPFEKLRLAFRGALIRTIGRPEAGLATFLKRMGSGIAQP